MANWWRGLSVNAAAAIVAAGVVVALVVGWQIWMAVQRDHRMDRDADRIFCVDAPAFARGPRTGDFCRDVLGD